jgi:hypothetical protein
VVDVRVSSPTSTGKVTFTIDLAESAYGDQITVDYFTIYYEYEYTVVTTPAMSMPVFSITKSGGLYATKGRIGPWTISSDGLVSDDYILTPAGVKSSIGT